MASTPTIAAAAALALSLLTGCAGYQPPQEQAGMVIGAQLKEAR